jgi:hypothetical protein
MSIDQSSCPQTLETLEAVMTKKLEITRKTLTFLNEDFDFAKTKEIKVVAVVLDLEESSLDS